MPFADAPDTDFVYLSATHKEAFGHLLYAVGSYGGFTQLTGASGSGKTTLIRTLLAQHLPEVDLVSISYPALGEFEFVRSICDELQIDYAANTRSLKVLTDALNRHLLATYAAGRRTILIVDEAQRLPRAVLEQVRLLTNLETAKHKLLRIILVGSAELYDLLGRPNLRQLSSRITARYHLHALGKAETGEYVRHRLQSAGGDERLISHEAVAVVHRHSKGNPRTINQLCDAALLVAAQRHQSRVDVAAVRQAVRDVLQATSLDPVRPWEPLIRAAGKLPSVKVAALLGLVLLSVMLTRLPLDGQQSPAATAVVTAASPEFVPIQAASEAASKGLGAPPVVMTAMPKARPRVTPAPRPSRPVVAAKQSPLPSTPAAVPEQARPASIAVVATATAAAVVGPAPEPRPPPPPAGAGLRELLQADQPLQTVMTRLAQLWDRGIALPAGTNVCDELPAHDLQCRTGSGDLGALRALNKPVVLSIVLETGQTRRVLLRGLSANFASIESAVGTLVIPNETLGSMWSGEYTAIVERDGQIRDRAPHLSGR